MIKIGIIGEFLKTSSILIKICKSSHYNVKITTIGNLIYRNFKHTDIVIVNITPLYMSSSYIDKLNFNIIIINEMPLSNSSIRKDLNIPLNNILLVNSDNDNIYKISKYINSCIVTYGFNNKASVTFSSVVNEEYETIQCCIQRSIPTLSGKTIDEQEFSVNVRSCDIDYVLAAVTAALINDIDIKNINSQIL